MKLVTRAEWGARPPKRVTLLRPADLRGIAIHYSGSDADEQADHANCAARVRAIQRFHMDGRGWDDIAYSFLGCKHGYIFEGRTWGVRSAANGTSWGNAEYHAVCFLGDDTAGRDDVTDAGRGALRDIIEEGWRLYPHARDVKPHSWFKPTGCPGDDLRAWIAAGCPRPIVEPNPIPGGKMKHPYLGITLGADGNSSWLPVPEGYSADDIVSVSCRGPAPAPTFLRHPSDGAHFALTGGAPEGRYDFWLIVEKMATG